METGWTKEEIYLLNHRAYGFYRQGRYQEAGIIFEAVTRLDPGNGYARSALAAVSLALGHPERAIEQLSLLLERNPLDVEARARRAEAYCELASWKEVMSELGALRRDGERHHVERLNWRLKARGVTESLATSPPPTR